MNKDRYNNSQVGVALAVATGLDSFDDFASSS